MSAHLLVVEDDRRIVEFLERGLRAHGYRVTSCPDAASALREGARDDVDLIVLDLTLPDGDGLEVLAALRGQGVVTPVLVLTARGGADAAVTGLDAGADDYLSKPFRFDELVARVRARLRSSPASGPSSPARLAAGGVTVDLARRTAIAGDREHELSARELDLLAAFVRRAGQALSREDLLSEVWGLGHDPGSNVVDVYVGYLRRKLGAGAIATVRGVGYRFDGRDHRG